MGSGVMSAPGMGRKTWSMICCFLLSSFTSVFLLDGGIADLGLLLVLFGLVTRIVLLVRCPFDPRDNLLASCEAGSCLDQSSKPASDLAYCGKGGNGAA